MMPKRDTRMSYGSAGAVAVAMSFVSKTMACSPEGMRVRASSTSAGEISKP